MQLQWMFMLFALRLAAFTLRFAPFYLAFSTKTHCILHQNALRLAPYCTAFSGKMPQMWCKWRCFEINIHFIVFTN